MVQPAQAEIETPHILVLSSGGDGLLHGGDCFAVATEIGLEDREVEESILVKSTVAVVHGIVKVTVEIVKGRRVIASLPGIQKSSSMSGLLPQARKWDDSGLEIAYFT